ncbi:MAG: hypothetical protein IJF52_00605 [Clostridia bacterium]|nr:hypothetical protein [Clostridia bacterium]
MADLKCIDVSEWQGSIDFKKVKASGIDYAILRAGFGREASQIDAEFEASYKKAKAAGVKLGAYWYSYAVDEADARKEAQAFLKVIKGKSFELPLFYDMEDNSQTSLGKATLTKMAKAFMKVISDAGFRVGIYANANWFENYLDYSGLYGTYFVWLAQYNSEPEFKCDIWQYTSEAKADGVSGNVDMNVIYNQSLIKTKPKEEQSLEVAGVQALLRQAYAQGIVKTFVKPIDNKQGNLTNAAIKEAKTALGLEVINTEVDLKFIADLEHLVNIRRQESFDKARNDVNGDGKVNIRDATALQKKIAGVEDV